MEALIVICLLVLYITYNFWRAAQRYDRMFRAEGDERIDEYLAESCPGYKSRRVAAACELNALQGESDARTTD